MFMLIYALCYLPGHIVPELLFRCVTLAARNRNFGFRSRAGKFSTNAMVHLAVRFDRAKYQTNDFTDVHAEFPRYSHRSFRRIDATLETYNKTRRAQNHVYYNNASSQLSCEKMNWNETESYCVLIFYQIHVRRKKSCDFLIK